ncbi:hypothetical protein JEZ35_21205 [Pseudomonas aeruginosa]|nr:hypothetical protein [Pseudomonas aeruginosa]
MPLIVVAPDRPALLLADHRVLAAQLQRGVGLPLVGVVKRPLAGVRVDLLHDGNAVVCRDRHSLGPAIALDDPKHNHLARRTPAALALARPPKVVSLNSSAPSNGSRRCSTWAQQGPVAGGKNALLQRR